MVFQAALNALNPVIRIWDQIFETAKAHGWSNRREVRGWRPSSFYVWSSSTHTG